MAIGIGNQNSVDDRYTYELSTANSAKLLWIHRFYNKFLLFNFFL
jgi:hypothetical protein